MIIKSMIIIGLVVFLYLVVDCQQMSDKKRKEFGLGPKGQGR